MDPVYAGAASVSVSNRAACCPSLCLFSQGSYGPGGEFTVDPSSTHDNVGISSPSRLRRTLYAASGSDPTVVPLPTLAERNISGIAHGDNVRPIEVLQAASTDSAVEFSNVKRTIGRVDPLLFSKLAAAELAKMKGLYSRVVSRVC